MSRSIPDTRSRPDWPLRRRGLVRSVWLLAILAAGGVIGGCSRPSDGSGTAKDGSSAPREPAAETPATEKRPGGTPIPRQVAKTAKPAKASCASCHEEENRFWAYGAHSEVSCESCHGVSGDHVEAKTPPRLPGNEHCYTCHPLVDDSEAQEIPAPEVFEKHLRFVEKKHVIRVDREKVRGRCVYCHDPHLGR